MILILIFLDTEEQEVIATGEKVMQAAQAAHEVTKLLREVFLIKFFMVLRFWLLL
jgi:hypothetical protein